MVDVMIWRMKDEDEESNFPNPDSRSYRLRKRERKIDLVYFYLCEKVEDSQVTNAASSKDFLHGKQFCVVQIALYLVI